MKRGSEQRSGNGTQQAGSKQQAASSQQEASDGGDSGELAAGTPTQEQVNAAEQTLQGLDAAEQAQLAQQLPHDVHGGGGGSDSSLYGAAEKSSAVAGQLPFEFVLKGDRESSGQLRRSRGRASPDDQATPTAVIGQPTVRLEAVTLNPTQQADESLSEWSLPPEYQGPISTFYKRTKETPK